MRLSGFRALVAAVAALVATSVLAACGQSSGADQLTLTLGDQANGLRTLMNAAGVLEGTPYHVKWAEFQGAAPLFQAMQGGQVDTGTAADLPTLQAIAGNLPIKLVAATRTSGAGDAILVRDPSVRSITDLKGKTIVVSSARGSIAEYLLANVLRQNGLSYEDVTVQFVLPTAAQAAFNSGQTQLWATFDPYQSIGIKAGGRVLVDGTQGRVSGVGFISAARSSLADPAKKAAITDFLGRLTRAEQWAAQNQAAYAQIYAKTNSVPPDVATQVVANAKAVAGPVTPEIVSTVQGVADLMHGIGSLPTDVRVADVTDTSVYR